MAQYRRFSTHKQAGCNPITFGYESACGGIKDGLSIDSIPAWQGGVIPRDEVKELVKFLSQYLKDTEKRAKRK